MSSRPSNCHVFCYISTADGSLSKKNPYKTFGGDVDDVIREFLFCDVIFVRSKLVDVVLSVRMLTKLW